MKKLPREFYNRPADVVAQELLGKYLVVEDAAEPLVVRLTETEAYMGPLDKACHGYGNRRTKRTEAMFLPGGYSYVYLIYGMYHCFNIVTGDKDFPCAALIRGGEAVSGHNAVALRRFGVPWDELRPAQRRGLLDGPGKLCRGLGLDMSHNGLNLLGESLYVAEETGETPPVFHSTPRIGLGKNCGEALELPLRFVVKG